MKEYTYGSLRVPVSFGSWKIAEFGRLLYSLNFAPDMAFNFKPIVKGYHQFVRHDDENTSVRLCVHQCPLFRLHPSRALFPRQAQLVQY